VTDLRRYYNKRYNKRYNNLSPRRYKWLPLATASRALLALCAIVVLAQGTELSHSHDDLQSQLDCQICLKLGSKGKAAAATSLEFNVENGGALFISADRHLPFLAVPPAKSRAPPHYS